MKPAIALSAALIVGFAALVFLLKRPAPAPTAPRRVAEDVALLTSGKALFEKNCRACHGPNATGSDKGPPLIHRVYEPGHHGDAAFFLAVARGVKQHHWRFGDMPPQPQIQPGEAALIVRYVRGMQRKAGIF